ncbi:fructosamine-3-kinase-like [Diadema setosum]|uniref:fructosamine-3-kinase-like n=1 Tax=Diadema setosum TaxID=31175 RepID=UPI003B3B45E8
MSESRNFKTERGNFFVKVNTKSESRRMFEGERESLLALKATDTVTCTTPVTIVDHPEGSGAIFVLEHLDIRDLDQHAAELGEQMARLHLYNRKLKVAEEKGASKIGFFDRLEESGAQRYVSRFGFHTTTCCGYIPTDNTWTDDWTTFFARQRLQPRFEMVERDYGDREVKDLWSLLQRKLPQLLAGCEGIVPSLLHGDLHGLNVGEVESGPVIYDAASVYAHHEYELATTRIFQEFHPDFFRAYHQHVPMATGFQRRQRLYGLFYYLNNWNHLGPNFRDELLSSMRELLQS